MCDVSLSVSVLFVALSWIVSMSVSVSVIGSVIPGVIVSAGERLGEHGIE